MADLSRRLWEHIEPYLAAEDVELDDVVVRGGKMVRVVVDAEGGLDVERIAEISRGVSRLLDEEPGLDGAYTLEVSSPGLERNLRLPRHFAKAVGSEVEMTTAHPVQGSTSHLGVLEEADEQMATLVVAGAPRRIPLAEVTRARTVFRWDRPAKPGHKVR